MGLFFWFGWASVISLPFCEAAMEIADVEAPHFSG